MMTIASQRKEALQLMVEAFKFLESQAGNAGMIVKQTNGNMADESRTDEIELTDVISAVKLLMKTQVKLDK